MNRRRTMSRNLPISHRKFRARMELSRRSSYSSSGRSLLRQTTVPSRSSRASVTSRYLRTYSPSRTLARTSTILNPSGSSISFRLRSSSTSRSPSRNSIGSARSKSRSESPIFPKTHFRKSAHNHGPLQRTSVPASYNINREISNLAAQFSNLRRRRLPPISLPITNGSPQWPLSIPIYAISINQVRQERFKQRFLHASTIWEGTRGKNMDIGKLKREGNLISNHLTRGEIGCYDSHLRLWEKLVRDKTPMAIICEDDVNLTGDANQACYFNTLLSEVETVPFDIMFLSWFRPAGGNTITTHTHQQWCFHQLWAYLVTYEGLKKILSDVKVKKIHVPVDVALWESHSRGVIRNLVAYPPLCLTVGENSDTRGIR